MLKSLQHRIKNWWDIWVFVIGFPIGLIFLFFFWNYLLQLSTNPIWIIVVSIILLYGAIILIVSTIIAISENNIFISSFILLFLGVTVGILGYFYTQQPFQFGMDKLANDFYANVSTELISIVITVLAIESLKDRIHWRNYQREKQGQEKVSSTNLDHKPLQAEQNSSAPSRAQTNLNDKNIDIIWGLLIGVAIGIAIKQNWKGSKSKK